MGASQEGPDRGGEDDDDVEGILENFNAEQQEAADLDQREEEVNNNKFVLTNLNLKQNRNTKHSEEKKS
jgi:C4-type Zn-finger protein